MGVRQRQELSGARAVRFSSGLSLTKVKVVLANASIVDVNLSSHPDLYFALRGGGNNFGIVTRFDLETFPQGSMWGGMRLYPITASSSLLTAFTNFTAAAQSDPDAALILAFAYAEGKFFASADLEYAHPIEDPEIFHDLMRIESVANTMRITHLTDLTLELNATNPGGLRQTYITATFKPNVALLNTILELFTKETEGAKDAAGILPALAFQPITTDMISHFGKNGGNAFGIEKADGPLVRKFHHLPDASLLFILNHRTTLISNPASHVTIIYVVIRSRRCSYQRGNESYHRELHHCCEAVECNTQIYLPELRFSGARRVRWVWSGESAAVD